MIWSFMQRFGTMAISFVSNIVLARLLTPDDYGVIGMLAIFIAISNTFIDGGFGSALIQKKEPTKEDYSTIFWWNMFLSIVLYALLYVCAPLIAGFYKLPMLSDVLRVQGVVLIINALSIIQQNQLRKQLKFKRLATVTVISATLSAGIAIVLAWQGWGLWALVAQQILLSTFTAIILWVLNKWYPSLVFSKESFKQLFGFGGFILASSLTNTLCNNLQGLLIGKFFTPTMLGYYTQAFKLEQVLSTSVSSVVDQVSYPVLANFQDDTHRLKNTYKKIFLAIAFVTTPIMLTMINIAYPLVIFLYTEKWLASVYYFQILCFAGIAISLQGVSYNVVASRGKSKDLFIWTIIKRGVGIILVLVGMLIGGLDGLVWGFALSAWQLLMVNMYLVSKHIGYSLKSQFVDLFPIMSVGACSFIIAKLVNYLSVWELNVNAIISAFVFILIYYLLSIVLKLESYNDLKNMVVEFFNKKNKTHNYEKN